MTHPEQPDWDLASPQARRSWLEHAERCAECREGWLREDPTRLFVELADDAVPLELLEEISAGALGEIERRHRAVSVRWAGAAAWAAALALAAILVPWWSARDRTDGRMAAMVPAEVQVLDASEATRVVDLTVGHTQVVMIFDEDLEL